MTRKNRFDIDNVPQGNVDIRKVSPCHGEERAIYNQTATLLLAEEYKNFSASPA